MKVGYKILGIYLCLSVSALEATQFAYVTQSPQGIGLIGSVTPIDLTNNMPGTQIIVGKQPELIAITFDNATAYVVNFADSTLQPITIATNVAGAAIPLGFRPAGIAITPDDKTIYLTDGIGSVFPFNIAAQTVGPAIDLGAGSQPLGIAIDARWEVCVRSSFRNCVCGCD